jgi:hypothetical protein
MDKRACFPSKLLIHYETGQKECYRYTNVLETITNNEATCQAHFCCALCFDATETYINLSGWRRITKRLW